jgi:hypothetical protein
MYDATYSQKDGVEDSAGFLSFGAEVFVLFYVQRSSTSFACSQYLISITWMSR